MLVEPGLGQRLVAGAKVEAHVHRVGTVALEIEHGPPARLQGSHPVCADDLGIEALEHLLEQGLQPVLALRDQLNAQKLQSGQIDLWATGDPAGRYLAKQEGISGLKTILRFDSAELYLALNREVPDEVVSKLQAELDKLREEGFVDDIVNNYL